MRKIGDRGVARREALPRSAAKRSVWRRARSESARARSRDTVVAGCTACPIAGGIHLREARHDDAPHGLDVSGQAWICRIEPARTSDRRTRPPAAAEGDARARRGAQPCMRLPSLSTKQGSTISTGPCAPRSGSAAKSFSPCRCASALEQRQRDVAFERRAVAHGGDVALAAAGLLRVRAGDEMRAAGDRLAVERLHADELLVGRDRSAPGEAPAACRRNPSSSRTSFRARDRGRWCARRSRRR